MSKFIVIIFVLSLVLYANSIGGSFISDDGRAIVENPEISNIKLSANLLDIINKLLYKIAKLNPAPYHLFNIFLHAVNSLLVFYLFLCFFDLWPSFWGALVFSVHPIHTEAVSWISGKPYLLSTVFILASFLLYLYASSKDKLNIAKYLVSLLLHIASLFTSWYALLYPGTIILYDSTYKRWKRNWLLWLPYIMNVMVWLIIKRHIISQSLTIRTQMRINIPDATNPILRMAFSLYRYAKLLFWPLKLTFYRDWFTISSEPILSALSLLILVLCLLPVWFKKAKAPFFALGLFMLLLSPAYIYCFTVSLFAERYLYLPSVSFCMLVAYLFQRYSLTKRSKNMVTLLLVIIIGGYSVRTILRNNDWKNPLTFSIATIRTSPLCPAGYLDLGNACYTLGNYKLARESYKIAIKIDPGYTDAYNGLTAVYISLGEYKQAIAICKRALKIRPDDPSHVYLYGNLGKAYTKVGDYEQAISAFKKAIEVRLDYESYLDLYLYYYLGVAYTKVGDYEQAISAFKKAIEVKPDDAKAHSKLAETYYYTKQYDLAIQHCNRAAELGHKIDPEFLKLLEPYR